jgi:hypothetical protein
MVDSHEQARAAILAIYRQLCADHDMARQNIDMVQAHLTLRAKINDCFAAARLFDFNLLAELQGEASGDPRQPMLQAPDAALQLGNDLLVESLLSAVSYRLDERVGFNGSERY